MQQVTLDHGNGHSTTYTVQASGTAYNAETPAEVVAILESARATGQRLKIEYGDRETGKAWGDSVSGRIGRSTGNVKIPLIIANKRSVGGAGLLDHCIVRIVATPAPRRIIYQHPLYK